MRRRSLTAVERTVGMFRGSTYGEEQRNRAPKLVERSGVEVQRIALAHGVRGTVGFAPANHYRLGGVLSTLCGASFADGGSIEDSGADLGVCQACRAEASRLRATVTR